MIYRPYTNNNAVPGNQGGNSNAPQAFPSTNILGAFLSRLPYAYQIIDSIIQRNPKFDDFRDYVRTCDPTGKFQNEFTTALLEL